MTTLLTLLLVLAIVGFIVYLIITFIPMPEVFQKVIIGIAVIVLLVYVIQLLTGHSLPALK